MFIGHFAVALGAKKAAPRTSLGTLIFASQFLDLLWPILLLVGVEHATIDPGNTVVTPLNFTDYPFSHSLVMVLLWSALVGGAYWAMKRSMRNALILAGCVSSHWVLDALTHRPDLPIAPGVPSFVGLGLWNSLAGTVVVEFALFAAGIWLYVQTTTARDTVGSIAFWALAAFLLVSWLGNLFGPPPPDMHAVAWVSVLMWLLIPWAVWIDRHRTLRT